MIPIDHTRPHKPNTRIKVAVSSSDMSYLFATSYNKLQKIIELVLATVAQLDTMGEHKHNRGNTTWLH